MSYDLFLKELKTAFEDCSEDIIFAALNRNGCVAQLNRVPHYG